LGGKRKLEEGVDGQGKERGRGEGWGWNGGLKGWDEELREMRRGKEAGGRERVMSDGRKEKRERSEGGGDYEKGLGHGRFSPQGPNDFDFHSTEKFI